MKDISQDIPKMFLQEALQAIPKDITANNHFPKAPPKSHPKISAKTTVKTLSKDNPPRQPSADISQDTFQRHSKTRDLTQDNRGEDMPQRHAPKSPSPPDIIQDSHTDTPKDAPEDSPSRHLPKTPTKSACQGSKCWPAIRQAPKYCTCHKICTPSCKVLRLARICIQAQCCACHAICSKSSNVRRLSRKVSLRRIKAHSK